MLRSKQVMDKTVKKLSLVILVTLMSIYLSIGITFAGAVPDNTQQNTGITADQAQQAVDQGRTQSQTDAQQGVDNIISGAVPPSPTGTGGTGSTGGTTPTPTPNPRVNLPPAPVSFDPFQNRAKQSIGDTLINFSKTIPDILSFLSGFTVVVGITLIVLGLFKMKHMADFRNMMTGPQEIAKALMFLVFGAIFIWMPFILEAITRTIFNVGISELQTQAYPVAGGSSKYEVAFFQIMQVVGLISFIRGWFILSGAAKGQQQQGYFGRALTHIIAGVFLFHLKAFMGIVEETLGFTFIY